MSSFLVATSRQCCRRLGMLPTTSRTAATAAAASYHKTATGPVGLEVNPNSREDFIKQQKALLEKVKVRPYGWRGRKERGGGRTEGMKEGRRDGMMGCVATCGMAWIYSVNEPPRSVCF